MKAATPRPPWSKLYATVRTILFVGIFAYLAWRIVIGWPAVAAAGFRWNGLDLAASLVAGLAAFQCLPLGWLNLLRKAGCFEAHLIGLYARIWWVSYLYRYVPGKVLLIVERARMGAAVGIPTGTGVALAIVETLLAALAGAWVSLLAVSYYAGATERLLGGGAVLSLAVLLLLPVGYRLLCRLPMVRRRYPELGAVDLRFRDVLVAMVPYILHYLLLGLSFFLWARGIQPLPWSVFPGLCGVYALSHVTGLVTLIAPGGLGVREGVLSVQLGRLIAPGLAEILAVGVRLWFTLIELICLGMVLAFYPRPPWGNEESEARNL